jgi:hypothetical protein
MWAEAAKALGTFPEAVVTAVDADGYPVSVRQAAPRYDAGTGRMLVAWPEHVAVTEGPASLLCHYHDDKLWNIRIAQIKGRLERRGNDWLFVSTAFTPPSGTLLTLWRAAKSSRAAGLRYLNKRGLERPTVNWAALKEIRRRALSADAASRR